MHLIVEGYQDVQELVDACHRLVEEVVVKV